MVEAGLLGDRSDDAAAASTGSTSPSSTTNAGTSGVPSVTVSTGGTEFSATREQIEFFLLVLQVGLLSYVTLKEVAR